MIVARARQLPQEYDERLQHRFTESSEILIHGILSRQDADEKSGLSGLRFR
jgi:hypothetical protein